MEKISALIEKYLGISPSIQSNIVFSFLIILVFYLIKRLVEKFILEKIDDVSVRYQWKKFSHYIVVALAIIFLSRVWFGIFESVGTFFGLLSAGLAIALKDPLVNFVGWIFILFRKPLKVGDRIEIAGVTGDVIDLRIFQFSIIEIGNWVDADQSTGRIIHIPNGKVFSEFQANYTQGFEYIWNEIPILITFESNWKKAKNMLEDIINVHALQLSDDAERQIKEAAKKYMIFYEYLSPIVYTTVKDSGVLLTMRYLCKVRRRRATEVAIWEDVLDAFAKHKDIDFAYPTTRFYNNSSEGKMASKD